MARLPLDELPGLSGIREVTVHLMVLYVEQIERCFGSDSMVSKHERSSFVAYTENLALGDRGINYVPLESSEEQKQIFVLNMNKLLTWAGLEERTLEDLLK